MSNKIRVSVHSSWQLTTLREPATTAALPSSMAMVARELQSSLAQDLLRLWRSTQSLSQTPSPPSNKVSFWPIGLALGSWTLIEATNDNGSTANSYILSVETLPWLNGSKEALMNVSLNIAQKSSGHRIAAKSQLWRQIWFHSQIEVLIVSPTFQNCKSRWLLPCMSLKSCDCSTTSG